MIAVGSMLPIVSSHHSNVLRDLKCSTRHVACPHSLKKTLITEQRSARFVQDSILPILVFFLTLAWRRLGRLFVLPFLLNLNSVHDLCATSFNISGMLARSFNKSSLAGRDSSLTMIRLTIASAT